MDSPESGSPVRKKRKTSDTISVDSLTPSIIIWTSPAKAELVYDWKIEDVNIVLNNSSLSIESKEFSSKLSLARMHLTAKSEGQSLVVSLKGYSRKSCNIWASDNSFSVTSLVGPSPGSPEKYSMADQHISCSGNFDALRVSIPRDEIPPGPIKIVLYTTLTSDICKQNTQENPANTVQHRFKQIEQTYKEAILWDTEIKAKNKIFRVHKVVLASASEVFQKMFESDMLEKTSGSVEIHDVDPEVMSNLLTYIYTGDAPNLKALAQELMITADKYYIQGLVGTCMKYLETILTIDNAVDILLQADNMYLGNPLRSVCINFVQDNYASISQTNSWKCLLDNSKELASEIMESNPLQECTTSLRKEIFSYKWIINDIKTLHCTKGKVIGPKIESSIFQHPLHCHLDLKDKTLQITNDLGHKTLSEKSASIWICNCSFTILNFSTNQPVHTVKCNDKQLWKRCNDYCHASNCYSSNTLSVTITDSAEKFESYIQEETLVVHVLVTIANFKDHYDSRGSSIPRPAMYSHLKTIYETNSFFDVVIKMQSEKFFAHKFILASTSEVFQQIFQDSQDTVELFDISPDVLSDILMYIYTGEVENRKSNVVELLIAADRYHIQDLVTKCLFELQLKFTSNNVAETLALADQLTTNRELVKSVCISFIKYNLVSVFRSDSWKALKSRSLPLVVEVLEQVNMYNS